MTNRRISKYTRPEISNPWQQFTEAMKRPFLTERDKELILAVYKHRCLTSGQLTEMFFKHNRWGEVNHSADVLCRRRLRLLYTQGIIDRFFVEVGLNNGSSQQHVVLDSVGSYLVAGMLNCPVDDVQWRKDYNVVQLPYLEHTVAINDFYLTMLRYARRNKHEIPEFMVENLVRQNFSYQGENYTFTPDAYGQYFTEDAGVHFFLEIDRGTMTSYQFQAKVERYAKFYASDAYLKDYPTFPLILTVTTTWERAQQLQKSIREIDHTDLQWLFTTFDLAQEALLQKIWLPKAGGDPVAFLGQ